VKNKLFNRRKQLKKFQESINRDSYPRLEMILLVSLTGFAGFLTSYGLLMLGLDTIWVRYLISVGIAYVVFLALLGVWLAWKTTKSNEILEDSADVVDLLTDIPLSAKTSNAGSFGGNGGTFDGGGASGNYDGGDVVAETFGAVAQAEEGAIPLVVIGALLLGLFSIFIIAFSIVSSAPILFSELIVDSMLSASLYRRLRGLDSHHWLESAFKRTFWPFFFTALTFSIVGFLMAYFVPDAHSLGEIIALMNLQ
jgi:hypothetical protein